jgi:hypothetical protein
MAAYRRWPLLLAVLALGMQLFAAWGLASASHAQCSTMGAHTAVHSIDGACTSDAGASEERPASEAGSSSCNLACAVSAAPPSVSLQVFATPPQMPDVATAQYQLRLSGNDILRPPR